MWANLLLGAGQIAASVGSLACRQPGRLGKLVTNSAELARRGCQAVQLAPWSALFRSLPWWAAIIGAALRIRAYAYDRSLWGDEAAIALNVTHRSFGELLRPLAYGQGAPVGWLWAERAAVQLLGSGELALRLVPFLASLLSVLLFLLVARRLLPAPAAALGVLLLAASPRLIYYASETKQFESDVLLVLLVVWLSLRFLEGRTTVAAAAWTAGAVVAVWSSHAGLFAVAAAGLALAATAALRRDRGFLLRAAAAGGVALLAVGAVYVASLRQLAADSTLRAYWVSGYVPLPLHARSTISWLSSTAESLSRDPLRTGHARLVVPLAALGLAGLVVTRRFFALATLTVLGVIALVAATAQAYPLKGRAALYVVPFVLLLLSASTRVAQPLRRADWRTARVLEAMLAVAVLVAALPTFRAAAADARTPTTVAELRPAMAYVAKHRQPGDLVLVHFAAALAAEYYAPRLGVPLDGALLLTRTGVRCNDATTVAALTEHQRVWFVLGQHYSGEPLDRTRRYLDQFSRIGRLLDSKHERGDAGVYLVLVDHPQRSEGGIAGSCLSVQRPL